MSGAFLIAFLFGVRFLCEQFAFRALTKALCTEFSPLVLILDDLQ